MVIVFCLRTVHLCVRFLRVRSVIILQEKPQDREKLMLKFLKIMKVNRPALGPGFREELSGIVTQIGKMEDNLCLCFSEITAHSDKLLCFVSTAPEEAEQL